MRLEGGRASMFAHKMMRPVGLVLLLLVLVFAGCVSACAASGDPIDFTIQVDPIQLTEPGQVKVSLRVANTGSEDMIDPVMLYDPAGELVASFGDGGSYLLKAGAFRTWEGEWNVTQEELDAGQFAYTVKYHLTEDGELVELKRQAVAKVEFIGQRVKLTVNRTITPEVVRAGKTATVVYELYNSGNVALTDVRVKENISRNAQTVKSLPAGAKETLTFTSRIGNADLVSNASITFKAEGDTQTHTENVEDATITLASPNLKIALSSPAAGVNIGEAATLVITFINTGNVSYSNVTVTDEKKGDILTNLSIPAGATVVEEKEFILMEPTTFKIKATLPDNTGETQTRNAEETLTIGVFDPEKTMLLTLNLVCEEETVHQVPGDVRFHLTVTNNSNIKAEKVNIYHGKTFICTIAALEPGDSTVITRDATISQAGKFRFTAKVTDSMQNEVSFDSNTLEITYARLTPAPTEVPVVTVAPPVQVTAAPIDPVLPKTRDALLTAGMALGVLFILGFALFLVSSVIRIRKHSRSKAAYDHLELAERRDYTEPADDDYDEEDEEEDEDDDEEEESERRRPLPGGMTELPDEPELPHQKLVKPLRAEAREEAPAVQEMPETDGEGGYRVSRADAEENTAPAVEAPVESVPAEEAAEEAPRHRRSRRAQRTEDGE